MTNSTRSLALALILLCLGCEPPMDTGRRPAATTDGSVSGGPDGGSFPSFDAGGPRSPVDAGTPLTPLADAATPAPNPQPSPRVDAGPPAPPCSPACGSDSVCLDGACRPGVTGVTRLDQALAASASRFDSELLISEQPDGSWRPSTIYRFRDLLAALHSMIDRGVGGMRFDVGAPGDSEALRWKLGAVNLAAFLAQSMKETIRYDACDENNWDSTNGYAISNACGQLGQDYGSYDCELACPNDPTMALTAVTHAKWYGAPGPLFCAPNGQLIAAGKMRGGRTGRWDHASDCWPYPATQAGFVTPGSPAWSRPDCEVYAGQKGGRWVWDGSGGSVQGCCWWGRGVIQTTGRCNFGTLNHYLGAGHLDPVRHPRPFAVLYPDVDFCSDPEAVCSSTAHPELKWIAGLFYWMSSVQTYERDGWSYRAALRAFVEGGAAGDAFIDSVSGIVNRGCHSPPCATGAVDGSAERRDNFRRVLAVLGVR